MALEIQGQGFVGIAFETAWGTAVPPTKFFPARNIDLSYSQDTTWRRPIRGLADNLGGVAGFSHVSGTIEMELMENILPYFMYVARLNVAKTGTVSPGFTYTGTPLHFGAQTSLPATKKGLTITVMKATSAYAFTGCVVGGFEFGVDGACPTVKFTIVGKDEATATTPTYVEDVASIPFGAGMWNIQIPTAAQIFDCDGISITIDDNAEAQFRLSDTRFAPFIKFGERTVTAQLDRDYTGRTEYDAFKALTATSAKVLLTRGANNQVTITLPRAIPDTYDIGALSSQGDLVRASVQYQGVYDTATSAAGTIICQTQESIT